MPVATLLKEGSVDEDVREIQTLLAAKGFDPGPADGVFVFPSIRSDCIEGGGQQLFDRYGAMADELEFGDELRDSIERNVFGEMQKLSFDTAGRITLPEALCDQYGITDWVAVVGLRDRFEIWERDAYRAQRAADRERARSGLAEMRVQQRAARLNGGAR